MNSNSEKKPIYKKWWAWVIAVVLLSGIGSAMRGGNNSSDSTVPAQTSVSEFDYSSWFETTENSEEVTSSISETSAVTSDSEPAPFVLDISGYGVENWGEIDTGNLKLNTGELLSAIYSEGDVVVVKAKIQTLLSNRQTVIQNYFNVCDLIKNHGFGACQELQYWAVADTVNGDEIKVISFTLNRATIESVENGVIPENQLGDYVNDLFIHQSLVD